MNRQPKFSKTTECPLFQLRPGKRRGEEGGVDSGLRSTMVMSSPPVLSLESTGAQRASARQPGQGWDGGLVAPLPEPTAWLPWSPDWPLTLASDRLAGSIPLGPLLHVDGVLKCAVSACRASSTLPGGLVNEMSRSGTLAQVEYCFCFFFQNQSL